MLEFTVFISVKIANLNELSTSIPEMVNSEDKMDNDIINIKTEMKYLFISLVSTFVSENSSLLIKTLSFQRMTKESTELVGAAAARLSRYEGMEAHARTGDVRLKKYGYLK